MSNTPITDELDRELHAKGVLADRYSDMLDHSRDLERETAELEKEVVDQMKTIGEQQSEIARLRWLVRQVVTDLPHKRDWLNPDYEREMRDVANNEVRESRLKTNE